MKTKNIIRKNLKNNGITYHRRKNVVSVVVDENVLLANVLSVVKPMLSAFAK